MATKFWRITLKGEKTLAEVEAAVGESGGIPLRVHFEGGQTQVFFEAEKPALAGLVKAAGGATEPVEVSAKELMDIG